MKLINLGYKFTNHNVQLSINSSSSSYIKLWDLDKTLIGTNEYMGFAYFWDHEVKHTMREATTKFKKVVHDTALKNGLVFIKGKMGRYDILNDFSYTDVFYLPTTKELKEIINLAVVKFKMNDQIKFGSKHSYLLKGA